MSLILQSIKRNIFIAINLKKNESAKPKQETSPSADVMSSVTSATCTGIVDRLRSETCSSTEQRYRDLLETAVNQSPEKQRADRTLSEVSEQNSTMSADEPPEIPTKKRQSVTFDTSGLSDPTTPPTDLLCAPIEICDSEPTDYNHVEFNTPRKSPTTIITTFTVAKPGYETKILLDDHGYSHVDLRDNKLVITNDEKYRSLSNVSSQSSLSCRSASVGSKDSGIPNTADTELIHSAVMTHRPTNSFDSAVSTSSTVDTIETQTETCTAASLTVEIQEIEISAEELKMAEKAMTYHEAPIYQDVSIDECNETVENDNTEKEKVYTKPALKKSSSTGNVKTENEYEDLNIYRKGKKNLVKLLGMDPSIDPSSVPPSLPERPLSYKVRRKSYTHDKKLFTLPFRNKKKMRERAASISSSSSGSDDGNKDKKKKNLSIKVWPLGNKSVIVDNEGIYQPVAIQRFLKDSEGAMGPQKRERSSSLNLNTANLTMKRPSIQSARDFSVVEKKNAQWKHNRNVSMQMDILNQFNDPDTTMLKAGNVTDLSFRPDLFGNGTFSDETMEVSNISENQSVIDEPIYAELEPTKGRSNNCYSNPFPNLTIWQPADISDVAEVSELNGTFYENDDSLDKGPVSDAFNQGFVEEDKENKGSNKSGANVSGGNLLIDLRDTPEVCDSRVFGDIFNMGTGPNYFDSIPILPAPDGSTSFDNQQSRCMTSATVTSSDITVSMAATTGSQVQSESIYMDMSTCKNESIYVLPSSLRQPDLK